MVPLLVVKRWLFTLGITFGVVGLLSWADAKAPEGETSVWDEAAVTRNKNREVTAVDLRGLRVSSDTLQGLYKYPKLSRVLLADTAVTDAELERPSPY